MNLDEHIIISPYSVILPAMKRLEISIKSMHKSQRTTSLERNPSNYSENY